MRHFHHLDEDTRQRLFHRAPQDIPADSDLELVALSLGATLYIPADRPHLADDVVRVRGLGVTSCVVCLEDSIPDGAVETAIAHVVRELRGLAARNEPVDLPLVYVRVREPAHVVRLMAELGEAGVLLAGFVLPKFTAATGGAYLETLDRVGREHGRLIPGMPVIETPAVIHRETRVGELTAIRDLLREHAERVLAVRVGATDLAAVFALRRPRDLTVYDLRLVADALADIVNILGRQPDGFVVTGPVWEYFTSPDRIFKPQLRESPFAVTDEASLRAQLIARDLDGLIREVVLDRANGLVGKTVIHPTHVPVVHALSVVSHEEYVDALEVMSVADAGGGVSRSEYGNKMNEGSPHAAWARRLLRRAEVFGVAERDVSFVDLLAAAADPIR